MRLSPENYRSHLSDDMKLLAGITSDHLAVELPQVEGWTVETLLGHTGWVLRYATAVLQAPLDSPPPRSSIGHAPVGPDVLEWFSSSAEGVAQLLPTLDLDSVVTTFTGPQPAKWWVRRLAHEVAVHRWDAEVALGSPTALKSELAIDGIDEMMEVFAPRRMQFDVLAGTGETIHLHATDSNHGEWMLTLNDDSVGWEHAHAKGDVAARGSASDLLLFLWGRIDQSPLEVFGDASLLERWQQAATF